MSKTITLNFNGCYETKDLPTKDYQCSGIYIVYAGKPTENNGCNLTKLLYIGESENVGSRPGKTHESYKEWCSYLEDGEKLFYTFSKVSGSDREQAEAALIFHHQPPCNEQNTESFDYSETRIIITGVDEFLDTDFTEPS